MKLAVMQPYFFPYIGYWQLINAVDTFVIYDDVHFIKRGWINRNRVLVKQKEHMITLPLKKLSQNKLINEIEISGKPEKVIKTISQAYKKAPYFDFAMPIIEETLLCPTNNLALFLEFSIRKICDFIGIQSEIVVSSGIEKNSALRSQEKILDICGKLQADKYINAFGGQSLYDQTAFQERGINLQFLKTPSFVYKQFGNSFAPSLSIIDVLMFNASAHIRQQVNQYELLSP